MVEQSPWKNFNQVKARLNCKLELPTRPWQTPSHPCLFHMRDFRDDQVFFGTPTTSHHIEDLSHKKVTVLCFKLWRSNRNHATQLESILLKCHVCGFRKELVWTSGDQLPRILHSNRRIFVIFYSMRRGKKTHFRLHSCSSLLHNLRWSRGQRDSVGGSCLKEIT